MLQEDATRCTAKCNAQLDCGHTCQNRCGACLQAVIKQETAEGQGYCCHACSLCLPYRLHVALAFQPQSKQSTVASMLGTVTIRFVGMILVVLLLTVLALINILCIGSKHVQCSQKCSRALLCGHECGQPCHGGSTCPPCQRACTGQCVHGQCRGWCTDLCAPCAEPCIWQCEHKVRLPFANMAHASSEPHNNSCMPCHRRCAVKHLITLQN